MNSPKPGTDGIYNIVSYDGPLYRCLRWEMRGWYRFCSGGVIAGVMAQNRKGMRNRPDTRKRFDMDLLQMDIPERVYTIKAYFDATQGLDSPRYRAGGTHFDLPAEYQYACILEALYYKWMDGQGGTDMWAGNQMNAKTFGVADKVATRGDNLCCYGFGEYLDDLADKGIVRSTKLTNVDGAHGGKCTTWLACIIDDETEVYLADKLAEIHGHLRYLAAYQGHCANKYKDEMAQERTENQIIKDMWED